VVIWDNLLGDLQWW